VTHLPLPWIPFASLPSRLPVVESHLKEGRRRFGELCSIYVCFPHGKTSTVSSQSCPLSPRAIPTTNQHLLFADDSLILMKADKKNADCLSDILNRYCINSGQKVSEVKSSIFFSSNTEVNVKVEVCDALNIVTEALGDKYLGLPAMVGTD
jgi:hypothetical protein